MRESGLDKQNVMRLRINRIALVQELRVEHVLRYLTESGILTEDDLRRIMNGSTPGDKARVLVDILTCEYNWYSTTKCIISLSILTDNGSTSAVGRPPNHWTEFLIYNLTFLVILYLRIGI